MGNNQIEDCSSYTVLLLLISWYVYAIYGSCLLVEDNRNRHCYVANDSYQAEDSIVESLGPNY